MLSIPVCGMSTGPTLIVRPTHGPERIVTAGFSANAPNVKYKQILRKSSTLRPVQ